MKILKAVHKNNPQTHSPQQNKKALLTTATNFKVPIPVGRRDSKKGCF